MDRHAAAQHQDAGRDEGRSSSVYVVLDLRFSRATVRAFDGDGNIDLPAVLRHHAEGYGRRWGRWRRLRCPSRAMRTRAASNGEHSTSLSERHKIGKAGHLASDRV